MWGEIISYLISPISFNVSPVNMEAHQGNISFMSLLYPLDSIIYICKEKLPVYIDLDKNYSPE